MCRCSLFVAVCLMVDVGVCWLCAVCCLACGVRYVLLEVCFVVFGCCCSVLLLVFW